MTEPDDWLGMEQIGPGRWGFELTRPLSRFDGKLYGGTGLAAVPDPPVEHDATPSAKVTVSALRTGRTARMRSRLGGPCTKN